MDNLNGQTRVDESGELVSIEEMGSVPGDAIPGTQMQLSFDLGSEWQLAESTLKLSPVAPLEVEGQFQEGDRLRVVLEVEVEYVSFPPLKDRGMRVGTERRHHGMVLSAMPVR